MLHNRSVYYLDKSILKIDTYQRIREEAFDPSDFVEAQFLSLVVSAREDGTYWIIDGQGRLKSIKMMPEITLVPCDLRFGLTRDEEIDLYLSLNEDPLKPKPIDLFRGRLAKDVPNPKVVELKALLNQADAQKTEWENGIGILWDAYKVKKNEGFKKVWPLILALYKSFPNRALNAHFIRAFILLEKRLGTEVSLIDFQDRILSMGIDELERITKEATAKKNNSAGWIAPFIKDAILNWKVTH